MKLYNVFDIHELLLYVLKRKRTEKEKENECYVK